MIAILLLVVIVLPFYPLLFNQSFFFGDNYSLIIPVRELIKDYLVNHLSLLYNPYIFGGLPLAADINQGIFYPLTYIFSILPTPLTINLTIIGHLLISVMGIYSLSRIIYNSKTSAFMSGIVWGFSSVVIMSLNNLAIIQSLAWWPWVFYFIYRYINEKSILAYWLTPIFIILCLLGGHPQPFIYLYLLITVYVVYLRLPFPKIISIIVFLPLISFILLSPIFYAFLEYIQLSTRGQINASESLLLSYHPLHLIELIIPNFFTNPSNGMSWGVMWNQLSKPSYYTGLILIIGLIYLLYQKIKIKNPLISLLILIAPITAIVSLGKYLPFFSKIYASIPLISNLRNYSLILIIFTFSTSLIIPLIAKAYYPLSNNNKYRFILYACTIFTGFFLLISKLFLKPIYTYLISQFHITSTFHTFAKDQIILSSILTSLFIVLLILVAQTYLISKKHYLLFSLFLALDLYLAVQPNIFFAPNKIYQLNSPVVEYLKNTLNKEYRVLSTQDYLAYTGLIPYWQNMLVKPPFADTVYNKTESQTKEILLYRQQTLAPNWNAAYKIPSIYGYATLIPKNIASYWQDDQALELPINTVQRVPFNDIRFNTQGVKYLIYDQSIFKSDPPKALGNFTLLYQQKNWSIYQNPNALPIVRTDPFLKENIQDFDQTANQIIFNTHLSKMTNLIITVPFYPGWQCTTNKTPCQLSPHSQGMMLKLPPGNHQVKLEFIPNWWRSRYLIIPLWTIYLFALYKAIHKGKL